MADSDRIQSSRQQQDSNNNNNDKNTDLNKMIQSVSILQQKLQEQVEEIKGKRDVQTSNMKIHQEKLKDFVDHIIRTYTNSLNDVYRVNSIILNKKIEEIVDRLEKCVKLEKKLEEFSEKINEIYQKAKFK
jgi:hypothetical protein